jgi:hypothetical protein
MNLVENNLLGGVKTLSIWQGYCIIKNESANPKVSQSRRVPLIPLKR